MTFNKRKGAYRILNRHNPKQNGQDKDLPMKALNSDSLRGKLQLSMQKKTICLCLFLSAKIDGKLPHSSVRPG